MPPGLTPLWGPGAVRGEWADVCGFLKPPDSHEKWKITITRCVFDSHSALGLREKDQYGCISHLQTLGRSMHLEINMVSAYTSKKDPPRTNATKEETEHMENKATIRNHHNHPYDLYALPCAQFGNMCNNGSPRSSSNDHDEA